MLPGVIFVTSVCCAWQLSPATAIDFFKKNRKFRPNPYNGATAFNNISAIIQKLTENYDIRLRPNFGGDALEIGLDIIIASFDAVSEVNMDYTLTLYLNQYWRDERLSFSFEDDNTTLTLGGEFADLIWVPDTFFANDKHSFLHDVTEQNKVIKLRGDGSVSYGMRFTTTLACMLNLEDYPMDVQNCTVEIESYGYTMKEVSMHWIEGDRAIRGIDRVDLPQFTLLNYRAISTVQRLATGDYQRLSLSFRLRRNIGYFIFQTYLPSILIVMLSWISFWINHEATSARVALGITTVLTMTTISTAVRSSLPRISYVKAIDIYLLMCFLFVFSALIEFASVNYTYWGARTRERLRRQKEQRKKNRAARNPGLDKFVAMVGRPGMSGMPGLPGAGGFAIRTGFKKEAETNVDAKKKNEEEKDVVVVEEEEEEEEEEEKVGSSSKHEEPLDLKMKVLKESPNRALSNPKLAPLSMKAIRSKVESSSEESDSLATASEGELRDPCLVKLVSSCQGHKRSSLMLDRIEGSPLPGIGTHTNEIVSDKRENTVEEPKRIRHLTNTMSHDDLPSVRICSKVYGPGANMSLRSRSARRRMLLGHSSPPSQHSSSGFRSGLKNSFAWRRQQGISNSFKRAQTAARQLVNRPFVPGVQDVSKIDRMSRIIFPALFILFNIAYWCLYLFGGIRGSSHDHHYA